MTNSKEKIKYTDPAIVKKIIAILHSVYPNADCTLNFVSAWELLVGGIIGAQCTDERVNMITPVLHSRFPELEDYIDAELGEIESIIRSCGFYRNKAKAIKGSACMIIKEFGGQVPDSETALLRLPGVGRKIANLVLSDYYGQPAVVVDTHCGRISRLLGFTNSNNPTQVEKDLKNILPQNEWIAWGHLMVAHGRDLCTARCRQCGLCPLRQYCAYGSVLEIDNKDILHADTRICY